MLIPYSENSAPDPSKRQPAPNTSCLPQRASRMLTMNQPSVVGAIPDSVSSRRASSGRTSLREARKAVVGNRLPRYGVRDELSVLRPDSRIRVERAHPDADHLRIFPRAAPHRRPATRAEDFREPVVRLVGPEKLFAGED